MSEDSLRLFPQSLLEGRLTPCRSSLPAGCSALARVVAADRDTVSRRAAGQDGRVEFTTIDTADQARAFAVAREIATAPMARGADVGLEWNRRVRALFRVARRRVTLIDRHAAKSADYQQRRGRGRSPLGLARFLDDAMSLPAAVDVEIITGPNTDEAGLSPSEAVVAGLIPRCGSGARRHVDVRVVSDGGAWRDAHYRCIAVDSATCLQLDYGIEAFDGPKVRRTAFTHLHPRRTEVLRDIDALRRVAASYRV